MQSMEYMDKLKLVRSQMEGNGLHAYIIFHSDPHISEYIPEYWKIREWVSGFNGSAGTLVVTTSKVAIWVDSRYFLQAEQQLAGTGIEICKMGLPGTPDIISWLSQALEKGSTVGFDGLLVSLNTARTYIDSLKENGFLCNPIIDLVSKLWVDRPALPDGKVFIHEMEFARVTVAGKLAAIREKMRDRKATSYLMCSLDEICWTFNIRGSDILYNPVVTSYAFVDDKDAILFVDRGKLEPDVFDRLIDLGVTVKDYPEVFKFAAELDKKNILAIDPAKTNYVVYTHIPSRVKVVETAGIAAEIKTHKSSEVVDGIRQAMVQDGIAMVEFLYWLDRNVGDTEITELSVGDKLLELRRKQQYFVSESFNPIVGYADHGAIVHYSASPETNYSIKNSGFLLIDSGGQYLNGTTDITRTVHLGRPTSQEMFDYTLVLKGMIRLSLAKFPAGTKGSQLDTLAKMALWNNGITYGHGTGHGVGHFLNVHEGLPQIRPGNHFPIEKGLVISNEPGLYRAGKHGIRIENLVVCTDFETTDSGQFLQFETLTLCPIDIRPINAGMLWSDEREWLNNYHQKVFALLSPYLKPVLLDWLKDRTQPI